jgi:hypothetical protein
VQWAWFVWQAKSGSCQNPRFVLAVRLSRDICSVPIVPKFAKSHPGRVIVNVVPDVQVHNMNSIFIWPTLLRCMAVVQCQETEYHSFTGHF